MILLSNCLFAVQLGCLMQRETLKLRHRSGWRCEVRKYSSITLYTLSLSSWTCPQCHVAASEIWQKGVLLPLSHLKCKSECKAWHRGLLPANRNGSKWPSREKKAADTRCSWRCDVQANMSWLLLLNFHMKDNTKVGSQSLWFHIRKRLVQGVARGQDLTASRKHCGRPFFDAFPRARFGPWGCLRLHCLCMHSIAYQAYFQHNQLALCTF